MFNGLRTSRDTFSTYPSRNLIFVVDPKCLETLMGLAYRRTLSLIHDLKGAEPKVDIRLIIPGLQIKIAEIILKQMGDDFILAPADNNIQPLTLNEKIRSEERQAFLGDGEHAVELRSLLGWLQASQADCLVTQNKGLIDARYSIRHYHQLRVIPLEELPDLVEICAHGNGVFWSASDGDRKTTVDLFYVTQSPKGRAYFEWFAGFAKNKEREPLTELVRSALLNRYPFLLLARDHVRFYELQRDHYRRRGLLQRFTIPLGYHVTAFYSLLWGMLDHLSVIAKHARNLKLHERDCGIKSKSFWKEFGSVEPRLKEFMEESMIKGWVEQMADMRHAASHRTIPLPTEILSETEESKKPEAEIVEILKKKFSFFYASMPKDYLQSLEREWIFHWRVEHMKVEFPSAVYIEDKKGGAYIRDPLNSVDHDLQTITRILDKFLEVLFSK